MGDIGLCRRSCDVNGDCPRDTGLSSAENHQRDPQAWLMATGQAPLLGEGLGKSVSRGGSTSDAMRPHAMPQGRCGPEVREEQ